MLSLARLAARRAASGSSSSRISETSASSVKSSAPEAQLGRELALVDGLAGTDFQHDQLVPQLPVGGLRLGWRLVLGLRQGKKCIHSAAPFSVLTLPCSGQPSNRKLCATFMQLLTLL
jgi:hypothetical protein